MPSERVSKILRSKSDLSAEEIDGMSDAEAWDHVYAFGAARKKPEDTRTRITLTGFTPSQKSVLKDAAEMTGAYRVMSGMAKSTAILVVGAEPGEKKIAAARRNDVPMMSGAQFLVLALHGVHATTDPEARRDLNISDSDDDLIAAAMAIRPLSTVNQTDLTEPAKQ
ncbi:BRCT domain-containing protein [uncultured Jannaschia sp.]|uniref:BRCT domain-containing protein n=1 Tax=uncultured Jannaschia sp. TaxID=293347 RepID=UPI002633A3A4|nr:BRCT domain-containing protein [uncultured Jannaschia sp.]